MTSLGGIGDLGEDMVEQSHQEGIKDDRRSRTTKNKDVVAQMQCKWEEKRKHPLVQMKKDEVQKRSVRTKRCIGADGGVEIVGVSKSDEKQKIVAEDKKNARLLALTTTSMAAAVGDGIYLKTGRQRNTEEAKVQMAAAATNIT
jgi:hypothetical protein